MNGFGPIAFGAGFQDGLNPCVFIVSSALIVFGLWLKRKNLWSIWLPLIFILTYLSGVLFFNFGPAQFFVFQKQFVLAAKVFYFISGMTAFLLGIVFLKEWFLLSWRDVQQEHREEKLSGSRHNFFLLTLTVVFTAVVLSSAATLWPINSFIMLLGNESIMRGQWVLALPTLLSYFSASIWPLWFVWGFLSLKGLKPSFVKIFCSSVFFTASSSMVFIFR